MSLVMTTRGRKGPVRLWTPAPRGPKLARYVMCGEGGPFILGTVYAFVLGTMGNWFLYGVGLYGSTVLTAGLLSTVALVLVCLWLGSRYGNLWVGSAVDHGKDDEQRHGCCAEHN